MHLTQAEYDTLVTGRKPKKPARAKAPRKRKSKAERERDAAELAASLLEPGTVICEGVVEGRAVPWKAPKVSRRGGVIADPNTSQGRGYIEYQRWKEAVATQVALDMARHHRKPYGGPVDFEMTFYLCPNGHTKPDRVNLGKCFEDATQGIAIRNDTEVCGGDIRRVMSDSERQRVEYRIIAI